MQSLTLETNIYLLRRAPKVIPNEACITLFNAMVSLSWFYHYLITAAVYGTVADRRQELP